MRQYSTAKRRALTDLLKKHSDRQFSVEEITEALAATGISRSAVYRNVEKLTEDGVIRRFSAEGGNCFLYQYVGGTPCLFHLHLKCLACGKIIHMKENESAEVGATALRGYDFHIRPRETILYGTCSRCSKGKEKQ